MRAQAAHALGEIGKIRAIEPLEKATNDSDYWVRTNAEWSLKKIKGR